jgi:hypothetical protein
MEVGGSMGWKVQDALPSGVQEEQSALAIEDQVIYSPEALVLERKLISIPLLNFVSNGW